MPEYHARSQKAVLSLEGLRDYLWCLPLPFLMGLDVGYGIYIFGAAYYAALIERQRMRLPALVLAAAGLLFIGRAGTFDVLAYGVKRLVDQFTHHDDPEYKTAGDYSLAKKEKRKSVRFPYWVYLALAGVFLLLALVFGLLSAPR